MSEPSARQRVVALAQWGIDNQAQIHYLQRRPMQSLNKWKNKTLPMSCDCSESITGIFYGCGLPDPNGCDYNGTGYTGTLLAHNEHITQAQVLPGDIGIFVNAEGDSVHAILAMTVGGTQVFSHGTESGPAKYTLAQEKGYHATEKLQWVRAIPASQGSKPVAAVWRVCDGAGREIARTNHPALWAARHPGMFRSKQSVRFNRLGG